MTLRLLRQSEYGYLISECTVTEIAQILNVSHERARQIEDKCIRFLQNPTMLKELSKDGNLDILNEYKESAIEHRSRNRK